MNFIRAVKLCNHYHKFGSVKPFRDRSFSYYYQKE